MKYGSLFSGIGGFDLAAEWVGWETVFQVEIDEFCNKILEKHWPNVQRFKDIREFDGTQFRGAIDVVSGGVPCQPASIAGKRKGKEDDRWLWDETIRVVREIKPAFALFENVIGLLSLENGKTFEKILTSLENEGYEVESFIIPACSIGAWHKRDRVWILAYYNNRRIRTIRRTNQTNEKIDQRWYNNGSRGKKNDNGITKSRKDASNSHSSQPSTNKGESDSRTDRGNDTSGLCKDVSNTKKQHSRRLSIRKKQEKSRFTFDCENASNATEQGLQKSRQTRKRKLQTETRKRLDNRPTEPDWWTVEPELDRMAHGIPNRVDRLKGLGNAIIPQIAYEIFKAIDEIYNQE